MGTNKSADEKSAYDCVSSLIELSRIDTLYGDLYLWRSRELLQKEMPLTTYRGLRRMETELSNLPNRIHNAMMQGNWAEVKELSGQMQSMKQCAEQNQSLLSLAKTLYEQEAIPIDPFSPGMQSLAGTSVTDLPGVRDKGVLHLETLMGADVCWKDFYSGRRDDLKAQAIVHEVPVPGRHLPSSAALHQEALEALEKGNFDRLRQLADNLSEGGETVATAGGPVGADATAEAAFENFDFTFSEEVLARAGRLGLTAVKTESRYREYAHLGSFIWRPTFAELEGEQGRALRLSALPLSADTPEALRTRIEMFVLHPLINSAGVRFLPPLVEEDFLVEGFEEPPAGSDMPGSGLLEALGLERRNSLTRLQIEEALAERGCAVVRDELGLDPCAFRLVCIPPDLHLMIGMKRGWGTQAIWTHFDGYMLTADGKMHALAGGDVRFGGIYDMVGIGRNYEADRIIARFAVVQRRRMARRQR